MGVGKKGLYGGWGGSPDYSQGKHPYTQPHGLPYSFPLVLTAPTTPTLQNFNCFKFSWGRFVLLLKKEEKKHVKTDRQYISS